MDDRQPRNMLINMSDQTQNDSHDVEEIVVTSTALLSGAACIFVIIIYAMVHRLREPYEKLIFFLGISDLLYSSCKSYLAFIMRLFFDPDSNPGWCVVQGSLQQYGFNVSTLIIFFIALLLYRCVNSNSSDINFYFLPCILISLILPGFVTMWFIANGAVQNAGLWCFVRMDLYYWQVTLLIHGLYGVPMIATLVLNIKTKLSIKNSTDKNLKKTYNKIKWFPLLQLCFVPIIGLRQLDHYFPTLFEGDLLFALLLISGAFACSNGLLNGIAYAWNRATRERIFSYFKGNQQIELKEALVSK